VIRIDDQAIEQLPDRPRREPSQKQPFRQEQASSADP